MEGEDLGSGVILHCGDSRDVLRGVPDCSIDSVVTDPPYALVSIVKRFGGENAAPAQGDVYARASAGFMGKTWDTGETAFAVEFWAEVMRVLKPGGHVLAFGGTRTFHRLAIAIEDAGFEIRDSIFYCYGSGFPKSHDVGKKLDATKERCSCGKGLRGLREDVDSGDTLPGSSEQDLRAGVQPQIDRAPVAAGGVRASSGSRAAEQRAEQSGTVAGQPEPQDGGAWPHCPRCGKPTVPDGLGTALKPALEPIVVARKPLAKGFTVAANVLAHGTGALNIDGCRVEGESTVRVNRAANSFMSGDIGGVQVRGEEYRAGSDAGRWPANVIHDGSDEVVGAFPSSKDGVAGKRSGTSTIAAVGLGALDDEWGGYGGEGSAARFFYSAKADSDDRLGSKHPTVKPVDLMQYLVRLVTPKGGLVLDPFAGTGTTGEACIREGMRAILIEREAEYQADIRRRMRLAMAGPEERKRARTKLDPVEGLPLFGSAAE